MSTEIDLKEMCVSKYSFSLFDKISLCNEGNDYVLGLTGADDTICAAISDGTVRILKLSNTALSIVSKLNVHKDTITGIKHCPSNSRIFFTSSKDGSIGGWDTRTNNIKPVQTFLSSSDEVVKPINCIDIDPKGAYICGGADQLNHEASLIFWDRRSTEIFDSYLDSHTDDITDVCYNPRKNNLLISGSVDGLINVFDVSQSCEDDALLNTLNTESSVGKLSWTNDQNLACITHTEEMQIWDSDDVNLVYTYTREKLKDIICKDIDYLVDTLQFPNHNDMMLMTGTNKGLLYIWTLENHEPNVWTILSNGHTDVVRCQMICGDKILTGGEDGVICLWQKDVTDSGKKSSALKQKLGKHQQKPY